MLQDTHEINEHDSDTRQWFECSLKIYKKELENTLSWEDKIAYQYLLEILEISWLDDDWIYTILNRFMNLPLKYKKSFAKFILVSDITNRKRKIKKWINMAELHQEYDNFPAERKKECEWLLNKWKLFIEAVTITRHRMKDKYRSKKKNH